MVRALAFHQCVPGSNPGPGVICGLSLGSLSRDVFERRASTGSGNFSSLTRATHFSLKMLSSKC